jgi:hypothetical protein
LSTNTEDATTGFDLVDPDRLLNASHDPMQNTLLLSAAHKAPPAKDTFEFFSGTPYIGQMRMKTDKELGENTRRDRDFDEPMPGQGTGSGSGLQGPRPRGGDRSTSARPEQGTSHEGAPKSNRRRREDAFGVPADELKAVFNSYTVPSMAEELRSGNKTVNGQVLQSLYSRYSVPHRFDNRLDERKMETVMREEKEGWRKAEEIPSIDVHFMNSNKGASTYARKKHNDMAQYKSEWDNNESFRLANAKAGKTREYPASIVDAWTPSAEYPNSPPQEFWKPEYDELRQFSFGFYFKMTLLCRAKCLVPHKFPHAVLAQIFTQGQVCQWDRVHVRTDETDDEENKYKWGDESCVASRSHRSFVGRGTWRNPVVFGEAPASLGPQLELGRRDARHAPLCPR